MNTDPIPSFVLSGLATMAQAETAEAGSVQFRTEADLRDAMAALWWLHGWDVRTEVKVPDCGRIDVLARSSRVSVIIEVKKKVVTPTQARQAFQQAHAYSAFLSSEQYGMAADERVRYVAFVTAAAWEWDALRSADLAYRGVDFCDFVSLAQKSYAPEAWDYELRETGSLEKAADVSRRRQGQMRVLASALRSAGNRTVLARENEAIAS